MDNQYQQQQQHYWMPAAEQTVPAKQPLSSGIWWSRLSLRLLSLVFNIAILALSGFYFKNWTLGPLIMLGPPAAVSFLWSGIDIGCLCIPRTRSGVHPTACLIIDFILFLALGALSGVIAFTLSRFDDSGYYFAFFDNGAGEEYLRIILGFGLLSTGVHLAVLFMSCFQIKRKGPKAPQIIYVQSTSMQSGVPPPSYEESAPMNQPREMPGVEPMRISEMEATSYHGMPGKKVQSK